MLDYYCDLCLTNHVTFRTLGLAVFRNIGEYGLEIIQFLGAFSFFRETDTKDECRREVPSRSSQASLLIASSLFLISNS